MRLMTLILAAVLVPAVTFAQGVDAPKWTASLGADYMTPLHGDEEPGGPVYIGSIGYKVSKHFRAEGELTWRKTTRKYVDENVFLYGGPTGIHGRADRTELGVDDIDWTMGVNLLGTTAGKYVSLFGGPGVVLHRQVDRRYRTVSGCTPPIPSNGAECREFDESESSYGGGVQVIGGIEVHPHRNLTLFVAGRGEYRRDLSMGGVGAMGGLRFGW